MPSFAQDTATSPTAAWSPSTNPAAPSGQPNQGEMMKQMMVLSKLNENHKLLGSLAGIWSYNIKFWMNSDPNPPRDSKK